MFLIITNAWPAFDSLARISLPELPSAVILDPRYVKSSTSSKFSPCSFIGSFVLLFILMCLVFAMLALSPMFCAVVEIYSGSRYVIVLTGIFYFDGICWNCI